MEILNKTVNVLNRGTAEVGYTLHDSGVRRNWMPNEIKKNMAVSELEQLTYIPGGLKLLQKYLVINDPDVCEYLGLETEPEYFYTEADVRTLLTTGTLDQLLDCLDFAPGGVIDLIKKLSVEIRLNDVSKREAIKSAIGFDVTAAIANVEYANSDIAEEAAPKGKRRSTPVSKEEPKQSGRRSQPVETNSKYRRVEK